MVKRLDQLPLVDHKVDPRLEDRYRRRLHSPQSLAPNLRSRRIQLGAVGLSAVLTTYIVLFADFGPEDHCFSPVRRWFNIKRHSFWSLGDRERQELKEQGRL